MSNLTTNVMEVHNTDEPEPRIEYVCPECGEADEVTVDADVKWDAATQEWVIEVVQPGNSCYCSWCGSGMDLDECKRAIPTYVVGWNMPGYMPDNTPEVCATLAEAKEYLAENITHYIEDLDHDTRYTEKQVEGFSNVLKEFDAAPPQECNVYIGDYVYFITQE